MDGLCLDDIDLYGAELDDPIAELRQDVVHMLLESYGSNPDAPTRGVGLLSDLSGPYDPARLKRAIEARLLTDERISAALATITPVETGSYQIDLQLQVSELVLNVQVLVDAAGNVTGVA